MVQLQGLKIKQDNCYTTPRERLKDKDRWKGRQGDREKEKLSNKERN